MRRSAAGDRALGERLGAVQAAAVRRRGAERREEHEVLDPGVLGGPHHPPGRDAVELLDRRVRLVAERGGEVDDGAHAAQRVAEGARVGQVAERDLHADPLGAEAARVADEAADRLAARR